MHDGSSASTSELGTEVDRQLDGLVYSQAVRDFEVANARARDLTGRLVDASEEIATLHEELVHTQRDLSVARRENEEIRASATFRLSEIARKVRGRLRA